MKERYRVQELDYDKIARTGCLRCQKLINKGRLTVYAEWIIFDLVQIRWEGTCLKHFLEWNDEMKKGKHGIFDKYQIIHINREINKLLEFHPHEEHKKKNIESLR